MGKLDVFLVLMTIALVGKSVHTEDVNTEDVESRNTWTEYAKEATNTAYQKLPSLSRTTSRNMDDSQKMEGGTDTISTKLSSTKDTVVDTTLSTAIGTGSYAKEKVGQGVGMVQDVYEKATQKGQELLQGTTKTAKGKDEEAKLGTKGTCDETIAKSVDEGTKQVVENKKEGVKDLAKSGSQKEKQVVELGSEGEKTVLGTTYEIAKDSASAVKLGCDSVKETTASYASNIGDKIRQAVVGPSEKGEM